ncbi:vWA domain-containing protein [Paenibacillus sp. MBLB4367]|uniref:vWA domain-containing protein n=1 Tax=Paenibacillus sp. MBLB4367 TaxID=3384767 RepID=UPI0039080037
MGANIWLTGTLVTFIVLALSALAVTLAFKWYRPERLLLKGVPVLIVTLAVMSLAAFSILRERPLLEAAEGSANLELYKNAYWLVNEEADFTLSLSKKMWEQSPSADTKFIMGLAYWKSGQAGQAGALLREAKEQAKSGDFVKAGEIDKLLESLPAAPVAASSTAASSASSNTSSSPVPSASPSPSGKGQTAAPSASSPVQGQPAASSAAPSVPPSVPSPSQSAAPASPKPADTPPPAFIGDAKAAAEALLDRIDKQAVLMPNERKAAALLDTDRMDYVLKEKPSRAKDAQAEVQAVFAESAQSASDSPVFREAVARAAIYLGDTTVAEKLLIGLVRDYPALKQPLLLLSELYVSGRVKQPNPQINELPQYKQAKIRAEREQRNRLREWAKQERTGNAESAKVVSQRISELRNTLNIGTHLAYSLLEPIVSSKDPQVRYLLAKYYYMTHEEQKSADQIHAIMDEPGKLTVPQQYYVQALQTLPIDSARLTVDQLQQKNKLTSDVYNSFKTLDGKRLKDAPLTDDERSFSVHLSNELIHLNKKRIRISSVQAEADGKVELYVTAENIEELSKSSIQLNDTGEKISDFQVEKVSESSAYKRSVMMVMDRSGSMQGQRIDTAKLASQNFVEHLKKNERTGMIVFSTDSSMLHPLSDDKGAVSQAIATVKAEGGTNIAPAFQAAMDAVGKEAGERVIFMLSDGEDPNFSIPETRQAIISRANEEGITIFAIGFGAGYETLRDVAEGTGGKYIAAAGLEDLIGSFAEISKTMERSYKISYTLSPMKEGKHTVRMTGPSEASASKEYVIGSGAVFANEGDAGGGPAVVKADGVRIDEANPSRLIASGTGTTRVQFTGYGLDKVTKVTMDNKDIRFDRSGAEQIAITVSNNQSIGAHRIVFTASDLSEAQYFLSVAQSANQDSRSFGYATVYGDFIETKDTGIRFVGSASIDHFIYDQSGEMTLTNEKELTFTGLKADVNGVKRGITITEWIGKERKGQDTVRMERDELGKTFKLSRRGYSEAIVDNFGLELRLKPELTYEAKFAKDDGTLKMQGGLKGMATLHDLNKNASDKLKKLIRFTPTDIGIELSYEPKSIEFKGEIEMSVALASMAEANNIKASIQFDPYKNKLVLAGETEKLNIFKFSLDKIGLAKFGAEVGWENHWFPKRLGVNVETTKGVKLGATGLELKEVSLLADWSSSGEGKIGLGVGTTADQPVKKAIQMINRIPFIKIDENDACLVCLDGEAQVKNIGNPDWSFNGKLEAKALGFSLQERTVYFDINEVTFGAKIEPIGFEGNASVVWRDPDFKERTALKFFGNVDRLKVTGKLAIVFVPAQFDYSFIDFEANVGPFDPHFRIGSDLDVIR